MTSFVRCFASLFAKIQYVDDSAAIAPINIYNDDKANYITNFNGHLIHEISECTWDAKEQVVTSPRSLSKMSAVYKFKSLDWVKNIVQTDHNLKKKHVDPTAAFNFEDDFSVGTIHGKNDNIHTRKVGIDTAAVIDVAKDDEVNIISPKTQDGLAAAA